MVSRATWWHQGWAESCVFQIGLHNKIDLSIDPLYSRTCQLKNHKINKHISEGIDFKLLDCQFFKKLCFILSSISNFSPHS